MFAKHLPPSADLPRVLLLNAVAPDLPPEIQVTAGTVNTLGEFDAVIGEAEPSDLKAIYQRLRPGGRAILAASAQRHPAEALLAALTAAGFIHCLVEDHARQRLYRGERPPTAPLSQLATGVSAISSPFVFLLIQQTPNKPAWKLKPAEKIIWRAATLINAETQQTMLIAFTSLVKAVGFMQAAILAQFIRDINKVGKFRSALASNWEYPLLINPDFETARAWRLGEAYQVDPQVAITGEE